MRGAQTRKCTPPSGCGSAPTGRRRTKPDARSDIARVSGVNSATSSTAKLALIIVDPDQPLHCSAWETSDIGLPRRNTGLTSGFGISAQRSVAHLAAAACDAAEVKARTPRIIAPHTEKAR